MVEVPQEVKDWVNQLSDKQFVEFFYQVAQGRPAGPPHRGPDYESCLVITSANRYREEEQGDIGETLSWWQTWNQGVIALHDPAEYENDYYRSDDEPFCQFGQCGCGMDVFCYAKNAICPACGAPVYCS